MKNYTQYKFLPLLALACMGKFSAQEGFGTSTPNKATIIEVQSNSKGVMIPQIALTALTSFSPLSGGSGFDTQTANAMLVYNTTSNIAQNLTPGYYFWSQTNATNGTWNRLLASTEIGAVTLNGNVTGSFTTNSVSKLKNDTTGMPINVSAPTDNQVISWNGTSWVAINLTSVTPSGQNLTSPDLTITGNTDALLQPVDLAIKPKAVVPAKLNSGASTSGQVYTADGTGGVVLSDAKAQGYFGTFNAAYPQGIIPGNPNFAIDNTNRAYTGASITLPKGKFMVYMGSVVYARNAANTANAATSASGRGLYVYYFLGDSIDPGLTADNTTADYSPGYTGKRAGANPIAGGTYKAFVSGSITIENTTDAPKTYYIHAGVRRYTAADQNLTVVGAFYSGTAAPVVNERYLFAVPVK